MTRSKVATLGPMGVTYHKNWIHAAVKYKFLTVDLLDPARKEYIRAVLKPLTTAPEAEAMVSQEQIDAPAHGRSPEWAYSHLDLLGRVGVLRHKGVEVALFFKRSTTEIEPGIGEKPPELQIVDPADVWQRLDLLGASARRVNTVLKNHHDKLTQENALLKTQNQILKDKVDNLQTALNVHERKIAEKAERAKEKAEPVRKKKKKKQDRLCTLCGCYENYHEFNKRGKCTGCLGGKLKCKTCTFRPKQIKVKRSKV